LRWAWRTLNRAPAVVPILAATILLAVFSAANLVYHVVRKPTEMFFPVAGVLNKMPAETWRDYAPLFRAYSTAAITPEELAALAQVEAAGNPVARTYWRWRFSWNPFQIYEPASSAVGMYQMTDGAFDDARRYCIHGHAVVQGECWFNGLYMRVVPSHAVELASVYLDRNVAALLADRPEATPSLQQKQALATVIHLCGAGAAKTFVRRGFVPAAGERCGDHDVAFYLAEVEAMRRLFRNLAARE
jgi:hypothetical protein